MYQQHNRLEARYRFCSCRHPSLPHFIGQAGHVSGMKVGPLRIEADLFSSFQQVPSSHLDILTVSGRAPPPPVTPPHQEEALEIVESSDTVHVPPLGKYNPRF